jgi:hypothetical protein
MLGDVDTRVSWLFCHADVRLVKVAPLMTDTNGRSLTELVETTDEEGVTHYFEKIEEFECDAKPYALLIYRGTSNDDEADEEGFDEEYVVMRVTQEEGELAYEYIEEEEEFKKAIAHLETLDYDFDTDDDDDDDDDAFDDDDDDEAEDDVLVIRNDPSLN